MEGKRTQLLQRSIERYVVVLIVILCINIGIIFMLRTQVKVIGLLQGQLVQLQQDQQILASAEQIYQTYKNDIDTITSIFPDEETVLVFLQTLESIARGYSDSSMVKFAAFSPIPESDKLYLIFNITMRTDVDRLTSFLRELEGLPYMTRLIDITVTWVDREKGSIDAGMKLKLYVKNPFASK
jgi:hypothetical protein